MTEHEKDWLAERFEEHRTHLQAVAYRMLGSRIEAQDAVQDAWLRISRADTTTVDNLGGWLTTVVARVCLNMLRSRAARREERLDVPAAQTVAANGPGFEAEQALGESVGAAMLVVLETLSPAERVAFVLHDMFDLPFEEIATILGRSPAATRQLASRARRRVRGASPVARVYRARQREVVDAFLAASRDGNFAALLAVLDPNVVVRADEATVRAGATAEVRGAAAVAEVFSGRARHARLAIVDGAVGAVWAPGGQPRVVFRFTVSEGMVTAIDLISDPDNLRRIDLGTLDD